MRDVAILCKIVKSLANLIVKSSSLGYQSSYFFLSGTIVRALEYVVIVLQLQSPCKYINVPLFIQEVCGHNPCFSSKQ